MNPVESTRYIKLAADQGLDHSPRTQLETCSLHVRTELFLAFFSEAKSTKRVLYQHREIFYGSNVNV